ncbi:MAG: cation:proton antiporter [Nitrospiraceae bacterium]|nr:MAG: cation:proton antiporter [Nitrospiraceae bacterium]
MPILFNVYSEIAAILMIAAFLGFIAIRLRQPLIMAFIVVGLLIGPSGLGWVTSADEVDLLAKIGITLLLFVVGLRLDTHLIRSTGSVALVTGLGQVIFTSVIGYGIARAIGMQQVSSLYVAVALTFSSTIIIVKLLSDKREIDSLHGRIAIGLLIVQDLIVVVTLIVLPSLSSDVTASADFSHQMLMLFLKGIISLVCIVLVTRFILPPLLQRLASSQELLVLFAISWAVTFAALGAYLGFSKEVGAFIAGMTLASTAFRESIASRLVSLRDFLLLFFFIDLGAQLDLGVMGVSIFPAIVLSFFVLIGNPIIVMILMGIMGYRRRTGFLTGLTVAQISEFSLIIAAMGLSLGHISNETVGLITLVGIVTIALSTYMILYSHPLYERIKEWLHPFERNIPYREQAEDIGLDEADADAVIFGLGRYGSEIVNRLKERGWKILGIDFDPEVIASLRKDGLPVHYGDAEDPEFLASMSLPGSGWVVSTVHERSANLSLISSLQHYNYRGKVAVRAANMKDFEALSRTGVDLVLFPYVDGAQKAVEKIVQSHERRH